MEFVYIVKRTELFRHAAPRGFVSSGHSKHSLNKYIERMKDHGFFIERRRAEIDPSFKQIIPYCVLMHNNQVFLLRRFHTQAEKRLRGKYSIGIGGHINPLDKAVDLLDTACHREIDEEVSIHCGFHKKMAGIINDETNPVGSVHFGIVYLIKLRKKAVKIRETKQMEGKFESIEKVKQICLRNRNAFETWSQLIIDRLPLPGGSIPR